MREEDYTKIKKAVEKAGFFAAITEKEDDGVWIVLASRSTEGRYHGNRFRLELKPGRCYLVVEGPSRLSGRNKTVLPLPPVFYLVPPGTDLMALSLDCLRESNSPNAEYAPDIADRYQLLEVSEGEQEWPACTDPATMLRFLGGKASNRKLRLFSIACIRRGEHLFRDRDFWDAVEAIERFVDGTARDRHRAAARTTGLKIAKAEVKSPSDEPGKGLGWELWQVATKTINPRETCELGKAAAAAFASAAVISLTSEKTSFPRAEKIEREQQQAVLRDIFGNPFRPVTIDPTWRTQTVVSIAQGIFGERAFDRMPILADALEDAGCTEPDMLTHCRQPGVHVRGCWVVDLLLGKE